MVLTNYNEILEETEQRYLHFDSQRFTQNRIENIIKVAQTHIEAYTGLIFDEQNFVEYLSGYDVRGSYEVQLKHYPLTRVALKINGKDKVENTDFWADYETGRVMYNGRFPRTGYKNIMLSYSAGYNPPHPLAAELCKKLVVLALWLKRETPPSLQTIIQDPKGEVYNRIDKSQALAEYVYDTKETLELLPRKTFSGLLEG
jgi:hypothetical protein